MTVTARIQVLFLLLVIITSTTYAQRSEESSDLYRLLRANDSLLFSVGFNTVDTAQVSSLVSTNFEFYHDIAGAMRTKQDLVNSVNALRSLNYKARRQLVEGTLEVYPMANNGTIYGAVQTGIHQFYAKEKDRPEYITSTARFTHFWLLENGKWKLSRVFSYDHH